MSCSDADGDALGHLTATSIGNECDSRSWKQYPEASGQPQEFFHVIVVDLLGAFVA